jgi:hypothetical protein
VAVLALLWPARGSAAPPVELTGCSEQVDAIALERALSLEVQGELAGDYRLLGDFTCEGDIVQLTARHGAGLALHAMLELGDVPVDARPRLLAIVWGELLVALAAEATRAAPPAESTTYVFGETDSFPPAAQPVESKAMLGAKLDEPLPPPLRHDDAVTPRASREGRARRSGLLTRSSDQGRLFDASAALSTVAYASDWDLLVGGTLGLRLDALRLLGFYRQQPSQDTALGSVEARVWGVGLELAVWCRARGLLQTCAVTSVEVGRAQVSGVAAIGLSDAQALDVLFLSGAVGASSRLSGERLALELGLTGGFARGPTATVAGQNQVAMHGGFVSLSLAAVVEP